MDASTYKYKPGTDRPGHFSDLFQSLLGMVSRLIGFFTLTEEDRLKAGIYVRGDGCG